MDEKKEVVFVGGMRWFKPREGSPDFVKGNISIDPVKLIEFLKANKDCLSEKGYYSVDVKKSRSGDIYLQLNTYKKFAGKEETTEDEPF